MSETDSDQLRQAVCLQHDPDLWHQDYTEELAISLCRNGRPGGGPCPALAQCLDMGTDPANHAWTKDGVWGGEGSWMRNRIRAARTRNFTSDDRYRTVTFTATNRRTPVQESSL